MKTFLQVKPQHWSITLDKPQTFVSFSKLLFRKTIYQKADEVVNTFHEAIAVAVLAQEDFQIRVKPFFRLVWD